MRKKMISKVVVLVFIIGGISTSNSNIINSNTGVDCFQQFQRCSFNCSAIGDPAEIQICRVECRVRYRVCRRIDD